MPTKRLAIFAAVLALVALEGAVRLRAAEPSRVEAAVAAVGPPAVVTVPPPLRFRPADINVNARGFLSWAVMDRRTGEVWGSANMTATTWPASMIKGWLAADYLRQLAGHIPDKQTMRKLEVMIRDSDDAAAEDIFAKVGGKASIGRLIVLCHLTDTSPGQRTYRGWSFVNISAADTVRMADCIANGTAAGPAWTTWLLSAMRQVRVGDWGIRQALPPAEAATVSIKNGWNYYVTARPRLWHINCMAVTETWAMAVLQRYPSRNWDTDQAYGEGVCRQVAAQLLNPAVEGARR